MKLHNLATLASKVATGVRLVGLEPENMGPQIALMVTREQFDDLAEQMRAGCRYTDDYPPLLREIRVNGFLLLPNDLPRV